MKVYFGVCGVGLGHAGRCIPVAKKLSEIGVELLFSTYGDAIDYVKREGFPLVRAPPIGFVVRPDGSVDFKRTVMNPGPFFGLFIFLRQLIHEIRFIKSYSPNVIVSDSRASTILAAKLLKIPCITTLNQYQIIIPRRKRFLRLAKFSDAGILTIIGKVWNLSDAVLIPDLPPPYTVSSGNLNIPSRRKVKVKLVGPILPIKPDDIMFKNFLREKLSLSHSGPVIFIPISGQEKEKTYIIRLLREILRKFPTNYQIILSLGFPGSSTNPIKSGNILTYRWLPNRFEYLKVCDLVISRPGHETIIQSLCYGKPQILIPTPGHTEQIENAYRARDLGVAVVLKQEALNYKNLREAVDEILKNEAYKNRAEEIQKEALALDAIDEITKEIIRLSTKAGSDLPLLELPQRTP